MLRFTRESASTVTRIAALMNRARSAGASASDVGVW